MFSLLWLVLQAGNLPESPGDGKTPEEIIDAWAGNSVGEPMLIQVATALFVVLGLIFGVTYLFKKLSRFGGTNNSRNGMKVLQSLPLGGKKMIHVVRVYERNLVLGVSGDRIELLTELPEEEIDQSLLAEGTEKKQRFGNLLSFPNRIRGKEKSGVKRCEG